MFKILSATVLTLGIAAAAVLGVTNSVTEHASSPMAKSRVQVVMLVR